MCLKGPASGFPPETWPSPTVPLRGGRERLLPAASAARASPHLRVRSAHLEGAGLRVSQVQEPSCPVPEPDVGFAERRCDSNSGGGKGLAAPPTPGAASPRLLRSLVPRLQGLGLSRGASPTPGGLLAASQEASLLRLPQVLSGPHGLWRFHGSRCGVGVGGGGLLTFLTFLGSNPQGWV